MLTFPFIVDTDTDRPPLQRAAAMLEDMDAALLEIARLASGQPQHPAAAAIVKVVFAARDNCAASFVARELRTYAG